MAKAFAAALGLAFALAPLPGAARAEAGTVRGKLQLAEKDGRAAADLADAVVWVEGPKARPRPASVTVQMKNKAFLPRVVVVPVGGTVEFPNADPVFHNVFSASGENRFDLDLYKRPKSGVQTFQQPGPRARLLQHPPADERVRDRARQPLLGAAGADGSFAIEGVPAGSWTVKAWHERGGETSVPVTVEASGAQEVTLALDAARFKRAPHKNKFGKDYEAGASY